MAPVQVAVVPVRPEGVILDYAVKLHEALSSAGIRSVFDARDDERFGFKTQQMGSKRGADYPQDRRAGGREADDNGQSTLQR
ncbi:MAG: His/Gly/Thr/Pro-type tRNA ligase C-terminal domain-containing protein [Candidatus Saccharibacteria bacterium]